MWRGKSATPSGGWRGDRIEKTSNGSDFPTVWGPDGEGDCGGLAERVWVFFATGEPQLSWTSGDFLFVGGC